MRTNKYTYYRVIQGNFGTGWEDVDWHECDSQGLLPREKRGELRYNLREYQASGQGVYRIVGRRERRETSAS